MYNAVCARLRACVAGSAAVTAASNVVRCAAVIVLLSSSRSIRSTSAFGSVSASHSLQLAVVPVAPANDASDAHSGRVSAPIVQS